MHGRLKVKTTAEQQEVKRKERHEKLKLYTAATSRVFEKRKKQEFDKEALDLTEGLLASNPDIYTLWNFRREVLEAYKNTKETDELQSVFERELYFLEQCLRINPKSYGSWHHRSWSMINMPRPNWKRELDLCNKFLEYDERNFHCWDYRRYVVKHSGTTTQQELDFTSSKIVSNFSNFSSWHYRSKLLPLIHPDPAHPVGVEEEVLLQEFELVQNAFFTDPNDQSAWFYHKWLLGREQRTLCMRSVIVTQTTNTVAVLLSRPVNIEVNGNISLNLQLNEKTVEVKWMNLDDSTVHSQLWLCKLGAEQLLSATDNEISLQLKDGENTSNATCVLSSDEPQSMWQERVKAGTRFTQELSMATSSTLTQELESCQQLHELEPDNKWTLLTILSLMRALDPLGYENEAMDYLDKLVQVDEMRTKFYHDLRSKFIMENFIERVGPNVANVELIGKSLTALYHMEYLGGLVSLNLSNNCLSSVRTGYLLHSLKKLILDNNHLTSCHGLERMQLLEVLSLKDNNISETTEMECLSDCPKLTIMYISGNPVCISQKHLVEHYKIIMPNLELIFETR